MATEKTIDAIWEYMREGRQWRDQTTVQLALLTNNQQDCEDHEKRITELEGFQSRLMKTAAAIAAAVGLIVTSAVEYFRKG